MKSALFALVLALIALPVQAQSEDKNAAIKKMFEIVGIDRQMTGGFESMLPVIDQLSAQLQLNTDQKEELKGIYRTWFDQDIDRESIKVQMIALYAETFTKEEIDQINEFYQTPLGVKFVEMSPELMQIGARIGMEEAESKQQLLIDRLQPFIDQHRPK